MAARKAAVVEVVEDVETEKMVVLSHSNRQQTVAQVTTLSELRDIFGQERSWEEIEPSFDVIDKETFESIPVIIGAFRFNESKKFLKRANPDDPESPLIPGGFVSMLVASYDVDSETLTSPWVIVNDGGSGIKEQLTRYAAQYDDDPRLARPLNVKNGFRRSEYSYEAADGTVGEACTWYLG